MRLLGDVSLSIGGVEIGRRQGNHLDDQLMDGLT
jgi:hypothetical protein